MATAAFRNLVRLMDGRPLADFRYRDHGSLVSLSRFSTVGSLMGSLIGGRMAIEGRLARMRTAADERMKEAEAAATEASAPAPQALPGSPESQV